MSLESTYEVLEQLRDDGVQSFRGREIATGRELEVHIFTPFGRPDNKTLFERLRALPLESRRRLFLDLGVDGSTPYIVTDPLPSGRGFKEWTESSLAPAKLPEPERTSGVDEAVQILQAGQWRTGTPLPESLVTPSKQAGETPEPLHDLTMVFHGDFKPSPDPNLPLAAAKPELEPGEFTRMIEYSAPSSPSSAPPRVETVEPPLPRTSPPPPTQRGSEFTQAFGDSAFPAAASPLPTATGAFPAGSPFAQAAPQRSFPAVPPPPPPLAMAPAPATKSNMTLYVALGVLAVLVILSAILFLIAARQITKRRSPKAPIGFGMLQNCYSIAAGSLISREDKQMYDHHFAVRRGRASEVPIWRFAFNAVCVGPCS